MIISPRITTTEEEMVEEAEEIFVIAIVTIVATTAVETGMKETAGIIFSPAAMSTRNPRKIELKNVTEQPLKLHRQLQVLI